MAKRFFAEKSWSQRALDGAIVLMTYLSGQLVVLLLFRAASIQTETEALQRPSYVITSYLLGGGVMLAVLGYVFRRLYTAHSRLFKKLQWADVLTVVLGYGSYVFFSRLLLLLVQAIFPAFNLGQNQAIGLPRDLEASLLIPAFLALCVIPPLTEEMLFRGFLYNRLKAWPMKPWVAAIITSTLFGLLHGQANVAIDTFVLSMVMVYAYESRKNNLWVPVLIHATKNLVAFVVLFVLKLPVG
jgi:membrane protease YdiL (CAAX protease family)